MNACPSCGHEGEYNAHRTAKYTILSCSLCGAGLQIELHFDGPSGERTAQPSKVSQNTVDTDAYKLTATGPQKVVGTAASEASRPAGHHHNERPRTPRKVLVVCGSEALAEAVVVAAQDSNRRDEIDCAGDNRHIVEAFCRCLNDESKPKLILLDGLSGPMPVIELIEALRAVETGMNETRTPILVLGDSADESTLKPNLAQLGNARFVRRGTDPTPASQGSRIINLVDRVLNRGK